LPAATMRERVGVVQYPPVLSALLITTIWATGAYAVYTYLAPYLAFATGIEGPHLSLVLLAWGLAAGGGLFIGGAVSDRFGARSLMIPAILLLALAFLSLSVSATFLSQTTALVPVLLAVLVWGLAGWAFFPAQQARLMQIAGLKVAPIALSLNASFMYLGFSLGAALGSFTLSRGSVSSLGWVGALCEILALLLIFATVGRPKPAAVSSCV